MTVTLTNEEKKNENLKFKSLIDYYTNNEADEIISSCSYKVYSYVVKEWKTIITDFIHFLKKDGLDSGIQTSNPVEGFFLDSSWLLKI